MYKAFNIMEVPFDSGKYTSIGKEIYSGVKTEISTIINAFVLCGKLSAKRITANWFPEIPADIFISHSHKDLDDVLAIAGWLYDNFGIISFIDSCVWGHSEELLKIIDDAYCSINDSGRYYYNMRNKSTSHVHMMLSVALSKMIYNTEALFFYKTPNSITPDKIINPDDGKTLSPWIYYEIAMTNLVKIRKPEEHRVLTKSMTESRKDFSMEVEYNIDIANLPIIDGNFFRRWKNDCFPDKDKDDALNYLYEGAR